METIHTQNNVPFLLIPLMHPEVIKCRPSSYLYEAVQSRIQADASIFEAFIEEIRPFAYGKEYKSIPQKETVPGEPFIQNGWFSGGDARSVYGILAAKKPRRMIEIGSGNSTKFARRAIKDYSLPTHLTSIDPAPRAEIDKLCDVTIRKSLLEVDLELFTQLEENDILFHDGSHVTFNGTDTVKLFLEILPILKPGVIIHIHDICLPREYVASYDNRGYSEQYMLATTLLFSSSFEVVLPVHFLGTLGLFDAGVSFWMRKTV